MGRRKRSGVDALIAACQSGDVDLIGEKTRAGTVSLERSNVAMTEELAEAVAALRARRERNSLDPRHRERLLLAELQRLQLPAAVGEREMLANVRREKAGREAFRRNARAQSRMKENRRRVERAFKAGL